jgi:hypothetical protein
VLCCAMPSVHVYTRSCHSVREHVLWPYFVVCQVCEMRVLPWFPVALLHIL